MMIRLFVLALVLLAGPASAEYCGLEVEGQLHCTTECRPGECYPSTRPETSHWGTAPSGTPYNGTFIPGVIQGTDSGTMSMNANLLGVQVQPPKHCEDGWVMVEVASVKVGPATLAKVKKCAPAGDLKDPK